MFLRKLKGFLLGLGLAVAGTLAAQTYVGYNPSTGLNTLPGNVVIPGTLAVTGNTTYAGTFGITGNTTVGGTLGVTGLSTLGSLTVTGATSLPATTTLAAAGTVAVTGCATVSAEAHSAIGSVYAGIFTTSGTSCNATLTFSVTAPHGYNCVFVDQSTPADVVAEASGSTTTCVSAGTTTGTDVIRWIAVPY